MKKVTSICFNHLKQKINHFFLWATIRRKSVMLLLLLVALTGVTLANDPPAGLTGKSPTLNDNKRYLALMMVNMNEDWPKLDVIQAAYDKGFNAMYITVRWDAIKCHNSGCMIGAVPNPNWNPANRYWTQIDEQVAKARQLGLKIAFRVHLAGDDMGPNYSYTERSTYLWGANRLAKDPSGQSILQGYNFRKYTLSSQPAIDSAKGFLQEVLNRYGYLENEGNLLFISFSNTSTQELEYDGSFLLDYSDDAKNEYATWYQTNYGVPNPNVPTEFTSTEGKKWYKFRHYKLKGFLNQLVSVVKAHNSNIRVVNDIGSAFDGISSKRGTLGFKSMAQNLDGFKVNDDVNYDHRFSTDILRGSLPGKWIMNEIFLTSQTPAGSHISFANDVFSHGAKILSVVSEQVELINQFASDWSTIASQWINGANGNMTTINGNGTVNYTFDEILNASFSGNRFSTNARDIYQEWLNRYNSNPSNAKPVNVVLNDSELDGSCSPPAAPSLSASPSNITSGNSSTLSASGCSGGTITWSHGLGTGTSKSVSPTTTTIYTATCSINSCTSSNGSVTVTVNGSGQCNFTEKGVVGTWNGLQVQTRQFTINGQLKWAVVIQETTPNVDRHFVRGDNFVDRNDIAWANGPIQKSCLGAGETGWGGLGFPSGVTVPGGYVQGTMPDGAIYFELASGTCSFTPGISGPSGNVTAGTSVNLSANCSGQCSGVSYSWSGNGISGSGSSVTFNAPNTQGSYTYTVTASKSGCSNKTSTHTINVVTGGGGGSICDNYSFSDGQLLGTALSSTVYVRVINSCWYVTTNSPTNSPIALDWLYIVIDNNGWAPGVTHFPRTVVDSCFKQPNEGCNVNTCANTVSASGPTGNVTGGSSVTLNASCSGQCSGVSYSWSGNGISGSGSSVTFNAPTTPGTYTYTVTGSKSGCPNKTANVSITVPNPSGINCNTLISDVNGANCSFIEGWIYDPSNPNSTVYIDIYEGATLVVSNYPANKFRQDLLNAGYGNGQHAFEIATPQSLRDGQSHVLTFKARGCNYTLSNSPRTLSGCSNAILDPMDIENTLPNTALRTAVFPNPSKGVFDVSFYLEKGQKATIVLTDMLGRRLLSKAIIGKGAHIERINATNKATGTMVLSIIKKESTEVKKINITR